MDFKGNATRTDELLVALLARMLFEIAAEHHRLSAMIEIAAGGTTVGSTPTNHV